MTTVLYHGNCYDGFGAAWVFSRWREVGAKFFAMNYGEPLPQIADGDPIYMLDYSRPRAELEGLIKTHPLTVLDHHKTAKVDLEGLPYCIFDMNKSGARLTWEFVSKDTVPEFIQYIEDRDLWHFKLPWSREIAAWLRSYPMEMHVWDELNTKLSRESSEVVNEGRAILRFQNQQVEAMCRHATMMDIGGYLVPVTNASVFFSEVGEKLCELYPNTPFAGYYFDRRDGKRQWGLRSKGFDVSTVAKQYGGGGHQQSAGFETVTPKIIARD